MTSRRERIDHALIGLKHLARRAGLELLRFNPVNSFDAQRSLLIRHHDIETVIDVGAGIGQYARDLRAGGYSGRIVSFEPLEQSFNTLRSSAARDPEWTAHRLALSDSGGSGELNVAGNAWSSSLLPMASAHVAAAPESRYVATQSVQLGRLDDVDLPGLNGRVLLKLDVQGAEANVLAGAPKTLRDVALIETELSLARVYEGGALFGEMLAALNSDGFELVGVRTALVDPESGRTLQMDGLFARSG